ADLFAEALDESPAHVQWLAHAVHRKTRGNPFFSRQMLRTLIDDGVLAYDIERGAWMWSESDVAGLRSSDNVIELMVRRFKRLPAAGTALVQQLACVGSRCDTALLAQIAGIAPETVRARLQPFVDAGLLAEQYGSYAFLHDRVLESAYSLITPEARPARH